MRPIRPTAHWLPTIRSAARPMAFPMGWGFRHWVFGVSRFRAIQAVILGHVTERKDSLA
jgi:hypothetical protein